MDSSSGKKRKVGSDEETTDIPRYIIKPPEPNVILGFTGRNYVYKTNRSEGSINLIENVPVFNTVDEAVQYSRANSEQRYGTRAIQIYTQNPTILRIPVNRFIKYSETAQTYTINNIDRDGTIDLSDNGNRVFMCMPPLYNDSTLSYTSTRRPFEVLPASRLTPPLPPGFCTARPIAAPPVPPISTARPMLPLGQVPQYSSSSASSSSASFSSASSILPVAKNVRGSEGQRVETQFTTAEERIPEISAREPLISQLTQRAIIGGINHLSEYTNYYTLLGERVSGRNADSITRLLNPQGRIHTFRDEYRNPLAPTSQITIMGNIITTQNLSGSDVQKLITFTPQQINRNIIKKLLKDYSDLLSRDIETFAPNSQELKNRFVIENILKYVNNNIIKRISYRALTPELYDVPQRPIDISNFAGNNLKVQVYIYNREHGEKLTLKSTFTGLQLLGPTERTTFTPSKQIVCEVENDFRTGYSGNIIVKPPGGTVDYTETINSAVLRNVAHQRENMIQLIKTAAEHELDEEADIQATFTVLPTTVSTNYYSVDIGPLDNLVRVTVPQSFSGNVTINVEDGQITVPFKCFSDSYGDKKNYNFIVPLTRADYLRLKNKVTKRYTVFNAMPYNISLSETQPK